MQRSRLSADERRKAIIEAARPLFAASGFSGTSVRDIARAAGVSEALLYKHFSSKDALYKEILTYTDWMSSLVAQSLQGSEPGVETLARFVWTAFELILFPVAGMDGMQKMHERLMFYSLLENTRYARTAFERLASQVQETLEKSYEVALGTGEVKETGVAPENLFWFVHHLAMALNLCHLTDQPAYPQSQPLEQVAGEAFLFALRGIGLTEEAISKYGDISLLKGNS